jgi:hypothetical protein
MGPVLAENAFKRYFQRVAFVEVIRCVLVGDELLQEHVERAVREFDVERASGLTVPDESEKLMV